VSQGCGGVACVIGSFCCCGTYVSQGHPAVVIRTCHRVILLWWRESQGHPAVMAWHVS